MASSLSAAAAPAAELLAVDMRPPAIHVTDHRRRQQRIAEVFSSILFGFVAHHTSLLQSFRFDTSFIEHNIHEQASLPYF